MEKKEEKNIEKNNKKIILKCIGIIILAIILIFIIATARKTIIINNIENKIKKYEKMDNYYIRTRTYDGDSLSISEYYNKGNVTKSETISLNENSGKNKMIRTYNGKESNTYMESDESKVAILNTNSSIIKEGIDNCIETNNIIETIKLALTSKITTEYCNGKLCYRIQISYEPYQNSEDLILYIEKETGLLIRMHNGTRIYEDEKISGIYDYTYKFNTVTDEDVKEPNIEEYDIVKNEN